MKLYEIEQAETGVVMWKGEAESEAEALDAMAQDAGYRDYAHASEDTDGRGIEVREVRHVVMADLRKKVEMLTYTLTEWSNRASLALRSGQQQGRVELAQEILAEIDKHGLRDVEATLRAIVDMDAGQ